ncbi:MAG: sialate O-acetylesterase [Bacteroidetes bacterium]|nr:sialate O-acetylesterase [Bacteroidota bacterium]
MGPMEALWQKSMSICIITAVITGCAAGNNKSSGKLTCKQAPQTSGLDIYLLIGQSNMAGRAQILAPDFDTLWGAFLFTGDSASPWEPAVNPLNKYSTIRRELSIQQLSPGYYFAKSLMSGDHGKRIGLVVNARGGTSIDLWGPGTTYFNDAITRTRQAMPFGSLKAILWHQGESDVKYNQKEYPEKITVLINALRNELQSPSLPFIAGEVAEEKPKRAEFNVLLKETLARIPNTAVVRVTGLTTYDSTHFDTRSMRLLGERYATETIKLLKKNEKCDSIYK